MEQGDLADLLEISRGSISAYERDVTAPKGLVLRAWAYETGVDEGWLRTGEPGPDDPGPGFLRVAGGGFEPPTSGSRVARWAGETAGLRLAA
jgi:transcriptional regulator with XRE-family HTH domain